MKNIFDIEALKHLLEERNELNHIDFITNKLAIVSNVRMEKFREMMRVNMAAFVFCTSGKCRVNLNFREYEVCNGSLLVYQPNQFLQILELSPDVQGHILLISTDLVNELLTRLVGMMDIFFYVNSNPCIQLTEKQEIVIRNYVRMVLPKLNDNDNLFYKEISENLLTALYFEVCNIYGQSIMNKEFVKTNQESIFEQFLREVGANFKRERSIKFYAQRLGITPKYLSSVVKQVSSRLAGDWINEFVITEAKILLHDSNLTVQQISNDLNFSNQSFFGKYFSAHVGISPKKFRNGGR